MSGLWRALAVFVAVWGVWKEAVSLLACAFALPMADHVAIELLFAARGALWAAAAYGLLAGRAWARPLWLGLWLFTSVVMSVWWFATDPMSSSALFAVVSTVAAIGVWRNRLESM
jgi:hypothetical protein